MISANYTVLLNFSGLAWYGWLTIGNLDCRFEAGLAPHVVHMTVKPQDIVDEEDAKIAKTGSRDRDGDERSPACRCVIL